MSIANEEALRKLAAKRWKLAVVLTSLMLIGYFGFILLVAYNKPLMGTLIMGGRLSIGIVMGAGVILLAPILTGIYVYWANRTYDSGLAKLRTARDDDARKAGGQ